MNDPQKEAWNASPEPSERTLILRNRIKDAADIAPVASVWRHKKGGVYQVTGIVIDSTDGEARIMYQRIAGPKFNAGIEYGIYFVRPVSEWTPDRFVPLT